MNTYCTIPLTPVEGPDEQGRVRYQCTVCQKLTPWHKPASRVRRRCKVKQSKQEGSTKPCTGCIDGLLSTAKKHMDFASHREKAIEAMKAAELKAAGHPDVAAMIKLEREKLENHPYNPPIEAMPDFPRLIRASVVLAISEGKEGEKTKGEKRSSSDGHDAGRSTN